MNSKRASRASAWVAERFQSSSSHSRVNEVGRHRRTLAADGGGDEAATAHSTQARRTHEANDTLAAHPRPLVDELGVDPGHSIGSPLSGMDLADAVEQDRVLGRAMGGRPRPRRVVPPP